jgi:hypothetical protein
MRFIVNTTDGQTAYIGTPKFEEGGVLRIEPDDPKPDEIKGPTIWLSLGLRLSVAGVGGLSAPDRAH